VRSARASSTCVADQFPALGWFIISQILVVMCATVVASAILFAQSLGEFGRAPPKWLLMATCMTGARSNRVDVDDRSEAMLRLDSAEWAESKVAAFGGRALRAFEHEDGRAFDLEDELVVTATQHREPRKSCSKSAFVNAARTIDKLKTQVRFGRNRIFKTWQVSVIRHRCEHELDAASASERLRSVWQRCTFRLDMICLVVFVLFETLVILVFIVNGNSKYLDSPDGEVGWIGGRNMTV